MLRGGIAERGGVRVGHRIIEINNQSVVAVPHEKIVNLLATSVGEVSTVITLASCHLPKSTVPETSYNGNLFEFISDIDENNANINVPIIDRTRESPLHINCILILL